MADCTVNLDSKIEDHTRELHDLLDLGNDEQLVQVVIPNILICPKYNHLLTTKTK
jgi:hypothetical protein